ncbi:MAG: aminotransferase class I/II-fold pyridoxal phosphate-dependent enzyme [Myxococcales bacterium]|nr:aminotransferase class I/II-fold pyridoxal phosphate-dependent enzyme [Myxococcales bacterium]
MTGRDLDPAFRSYQAIDPAAPEGAGLNLAWTRDERAHLAVDLAAVLAAELRAEADDGLPYLDRYLVRDPYGEATLGPAVAAAFGLPAWQDRVTCGAGVVSLLHGLARLAAGAPVRVLGDTYPDFPYWVAQTGGACGVEPTAPLWFLERPSLIGDAFAALPEVAALCADAARHGALVVIDESNASYAPPAWSAIGQIDLAPNLIVLRGFSKAYGLGGLRLAYAVASPAATARVRAVVAPLLAASVSLRLGARVLALGDVAAPLRARITAHKPAVLDLLARAGVTALEPASAHLPYVLSRASDAELRARLEARGVLGKRHPCWSARVGGLDHVYRLSVPLDDHRLARLRDLLAAP